MYSNDDVVHDGTIYVREKGELHCVNNAREAGSYSLWPGYPPVKRKPTRLFEKDFSVRLCIDNVTASSSKRKDHFVFTYNSEGSLRYTAKSLFDTCLLYIADNVQHIESLVGFPEQMADRLFTAAEEKQKFSNSETGLRALQVFCEAYGDLVLRSLCLRNRFSLLSEKLEEIKTFQSLQCLDLHGCKLGDGHEIFEHLTSDQLGSLSQLSLGANCLSDPGLQKLTAPVRVMKRGLQNLKLLDVSYNPISERAVGYLACFRKLQGLDLSETLIKPGMSLNKLLWSKMRLVPSDTPVAVFNHSCCKTEGWAQEVVNQWEVNGAKLPEKDIKPRTNALHFYGRERFVRETLNSTPVLCNKSDDVILRLQFYRPALQEEIAVDADSKTDTPAQKGMKRKRSMENEKAVVNSKSSKRQSVSSFSAEDLDLLNSY
ncbi:leucine-rich repeat-containing protein 42 isoform X2 [Alosa alosa]|uniref:leucine-rich repeat-containing protein 42 isoform X2 n=1 Tax=Alosa alosa TaxID=278164 RepID=UPI00201515C1|nr:leucine-rich repeat-containing protein 42 isoform X2 [Alosa alosa]